MTGTITEPVKSGLEFDHGVAVVPDDANNLPTPGYAAALFIGGTGDLEVDMGNGTTVTFLSVPAGIFRIRVTRVRAASTTATGIVQLW